MKFQASLPPGYFVQKTYFLLYFVPFKNGFIRKLYTKDRHRMERELKQSQDKTWLFPLRKVPFNGCITTFQTLYPFKKKYK